MNQFLTKAVLGTTLAATAMTAALPADAQRYRRHNRGDSTGTAIVAGIAGLAIGAAIASSSNDNRRGYYDNRYSYDNYNNYPQYRYNGYNSNSYDNYNYNYQNCRIEKRYDPYYGRKVKVRVCY